MNWIELKALHTLYLNGFVMLNATLAQSSEFHYLRMTLNVVDRTHNQVLALGGFQKVYEDHYASKYDRYLAFLSSNGLLKPQTRFDERDIEILMKIKSWKDQGTLEKLIRQILDYDESQRGISLMFFRNEKYLDDKPSLVNALKQLLEVSGFANERDQQYIYKLECAEPKIIVLCENLDFLTKPIKPRAHNIELWYAGGKNVNKLDFADTRGLPIYYSCDWDYDGLFIIYPLVKAKIPTIELLTPNGIARGITETAHNSRWKTDSIPIEYLLSPPQIIIILDLIQYNRWIIEESNDLIAMLQL